MLRPGGNAVITDPGGVTEFDTFTCGHCGTLVHVWPRQRPEDIGGFCRQCMKPTCPRCADDERCDPLERKLERAEARSAALKSYGL